MGMDLSMVQTPDFGEIPDHYPEDIRKYPGYFRGVPDVLYDAGILDNTMGEPTWPDWPPNGLSAERAEQLRDFFLPPSVVHQGRRTPPVGSLQELKPTFQELRIIQRFLRQNDLALSAVSKTPGKIPSFKFNSNDGWHIIPEECLEPIRITL